MRLVKDPVEQAKVSAALYQLRDKRLLARNQRFNSSGRYTSLVRGGWMQLRHRILKIQDAQA